MESIYTLSIRMLLETGGMAAAVAGITRRFAAMRQTVQQAQSAVAQAGSTMAQSHSRAAQSALTQEAAVLRLNKATAEYARIANQTNAPPTALSNAGYRVQQSELAMQGATARHTANQYALSDAFQNSQAAQASEATAMQRQGRGQTGMGLATAGVGLLAVGGLGLDWAKHGFKDAIEANAALTTVGLNTVGTGSQANRQAQLAALGSTALIQASQTRFSNLDILGIEKTAATSGFNNRAQLNAVMPELARAAEIAKATAGIDPTESTKAFVQMSHLFKTYGTPSTGGAGAFNNMVNTTVRALAVSGGTPAELVHTMAYMTQAINAYKMSPEEAITTTALSMNLGLAAGRGGSRLAALYRQVAPTGSRAHNVALGHLEQLGGGSFFHNGQFGGTANMLEVITKAMTSGPLANNQAARMRLLNAVFGSAGSIAASAFGSQQAIGRESSIMQLLGNGLNSIAGISAQQQALTRTPQGNLVAMRTDITDINTELFAPWLGALNSVLGATRKVTDGIVAFLAANSGVAKVAGAFILVGSALAVLTGAVLVGAGAFLVMGTVLAGVDIGLLPFIAIVAGIAAAIAVVVLVITHWGQITTAVGGVLNGLGKVAAFVGAVVKNALHNPIVQFLLLITGIGPVVALLVGLFTHFGLVMSTLGNIFKVVGGYLNTYIVTPLTDALKLLLNFEGGAAGKAFDALSNFAGVGTNNPANPLATTAANGHYVKPGDTATYAKGHGFGGGGVGYQHNGDIHHHITVHGADHATAEALANHIAGKVMEKHAATMSKHNANSARGAAHMSPRFRGA